MKSSITTTVTQKGQITLPKAFRDALKISPYDTVELILKNNLIKVRSTKDVLDFAGTVTPKKNKNLHPVAARNLLDKKYSRV